MKIKPREFWFVVLDDDRKEFWIDGPMTNDEALNNAVRRAQEQGRSVRCRSASVDSPKQYLKHICVRDGYKEAENPIVVPNHWAD
jgi:hypothetical protein